MLEIVLSYILLLFWFLSVIFLGKSDTMKRIYKKYLPDSKLVYVFVEILFIGYILCGLYFILMFIQDA